MRGGTPNCPSGATAADLLVGNTRAPLSVRADGTFTAGYVVTGSRTPSSPYDSNITCGDWTNANAGNEYGHSHAIGTPAFAQTTSECMIAQSVYCLER